MRHEAEADAVPARGWWFVGVIYLWWWAQARVQVAATLGGGRGDAPLAALALGVALSKLIGHLLEAGVYLGTFRAIVRPLRFGPTFARIAVLSGLDLVALALIEEARVRGGAVALAIAFLAGPNALHAAAGTGIGGLEAAFGGFGLLAALRVLGTAALIRRGASVGWPLAAGTVALYWLATRLVAWWSADLLRGMSPLGS